MQTLSGILFVSSFFSSVPLLTTQSYTVPLMLSPQYAGWRAKIGLLFGGFTLLFWIPCYFLFPEVSPAPRSWDHALTDLSVKIGHTRNSTSYTQAVFRSGTLRRPRRLHSLRESSEIRTGRPRLDLDVSFAVPAWCWRDQVGEISQ
jgi:hypothetical protein